MLSPTDRCSRKSGAMFGCADDISSLLSSLQRFSRRNETACSFPAQHHRTLYQADTQARVAPGLRMVLHVAASHGVPASV